MPNNAIKKHSHFLSLPIMENALFQGLSHAVVLSLTDEDGHILYANEKFMELSGYSQEELFGKNHKLLNSGFHTKNFFPEMWAQIRSGRPWEGDICNRNKSGSLYWIRSFINPFTDQEGRKFYVNAATDITERKELENKLVQSIEWQEAFLNSANFSIVSTNAQGIIQTVNQTAVKMLGYSAEELIGKATPAIYRDANEIKVFSQSAEKEFQQKPVSEFASITAKATKLGKDTHECTYITKSGERIPVRSNISTIFAHNGEILGYLGVSEDLSKTRKMESTIETQQQLLQASEKMASLGQLASGITHEINNPLSVIAGKADRIKRLTLEASTPLAVIHADANRISEMVVRISNIIRGMRRFSRDGSHDPFQPIHLHSLIKETLDLAMDRLKSQNIELRVGQILETTIDCQSTQISQVLVNLIVNACDAIQNLQEKWIQIETSLAEDNRVKISLTDSGPGIPKEIAEKMMQPFYTTKPIGKGTGLGLSIARGIIHEHKGSLSLNQNCKNTQFIMELPIDHQAEIKS